MCLYGTYFGWARRRLWPFSNADWSLLCDFTHILYPFKHLGVLLTQLGRQTLHNYHGNNTLRCSLRLRWTLSNVWTAGFSCDNGCWLGLGRHLYGIHAHPWTSWNGRVNASALSRLGAKDQWFISRNIQLFPRLWLSRCSSLRLIRHRGSRFQIINWYCSHHLLHLRSHLLRGSWWNWGLQKHL